MTVPTSSDFSPSASLSEAIDALIQNLTYANSSNAPTTSCDLLLNVTDAAGDYLAGSFKHPRLNGAFAIVSSTPQCFC